MKTAVKWILIVLCALVVIVIAALLIVPHVVDLQAYKPQIEKRVEKATGRPFKLGGPIKLSLFPWAAVTLSDLHLGNPQGFSQKEFLSVDRFEIRVKFLPLLRKDVQVKRFILRSPKVVLERSRDGRANWEGLVKESKAHKEEKKKGGPPSGLPIRSLLVQELSITNGTILWIDNTKDERHTLDQITMKLKDVSMDKPVGAKISARLDGKPMILEGKAGPLSAKAPIGVDLTLRALQEVEANIKGTLRDLQSKVGPTMDIAIELLPMSPRKVMHALNRPFPVETPDPKALDKLSLKVALKGSPKRLRIEDGAMVLDDTNISFSAEVLDPSLPHVTFDVKVDSIDLDRYMPPPAEEEKGSKATKGGPRKKTPPDYGPIRRMRMEGSIHVGQLKAKGAKLQDVLMKISSKGGLINVDPLSLKAYGGDLKTRASVDVRGQVPIGKVDLHTQGVQVEPLLKDFLQKDFLQGTLMAQAALTMRGDTTEDIKRSLDGNGDIVLEDGAIVGIDLAGMARNVKATFGLAKGAKKRPKTDFSELHVPFQVIKGVFNTSGATLKSPLLRVVARGKADLVKEKLDFYVKPKFVATLKGQGDTMSRSGVMVPVIVDGTFDSPRFRPDIKGIIKGRVLRGLPKAPSLPKILPKKPGEAKPPAGTEEKVKGLLKKALPLR